MAIIYTYPTKATPNDNDLILISDSEDSNKTKKVKISTLPGGSGSGVSSVTAVLPLASTGGGTPVISLTGLTGFGTTGQVIKVNSNADGLEWGTAGGAAPQGNDNNVQLKNGTGFAGSDDLDFDSNVLSVKHTLDIKGQGNSLPAGRLKLYCENSSHGVTLEGPLHAGNSSYTLKFPSAAPTNNQILQYTTAGNLGWIATPSGGGAVDSVITTNGTYIDLTPTTASTAAVTVTADLSAVDGTSTTETKFLSKNNTWDVPSYTTNTNTNIANSQLQLENNRTLDFYDGTTSVRSLSFIRTNGGSRNMFKFEADGGTKPMFTVGNTESTYEGYIVIEGNGSNRTGQVQFQDAVGDNYTGIKAATTQTADITYTLPAAQAAAGEFLKNDGTGILSWDQAASYEEGTWNPVMFNSSSPTYTSTGTFIKIGKKVTVWFHIDCTAGGSSSIVSTISGLPFNTVSANGRRGGAVINQNTATVSSSNYVGGKPGGSTTIILQKYDGGSPYLYLLENALWPNSQGSFTVEGQFTYYSV